MPSKDATGPDALTLYDGKDPRDLPRYTYPEAARATGVPASTIAAWFRGQEYSLKHGKAFFEPVLTRPTEEGRLSFINLIEVHVLRALRTQHKVKLQHVRQAMDVAERQFNIEKLLISEKLRWGAGELFLQEYGQLLRLTPSEQFAMREVLEKHLTRVEWVGGRPRDFFPRERVTDTGRKLILVSPHISFGRPVIKRLGVTTRSIADRLNAGEPAKSIIDDYGLNEDELKEAIAYEADAA